MAQERLDKLLSSTGRWSRKEVKELIARGRVLVDGRPRDGLRTSAIPRAPISRWTGRQWTAPPVCTSCCISSGLLSATQDKKQATVLDLLPEHLRRRGLFPVGRLDKDTEGLLLLTDDGPLGMIFCLPASMWIRSTMPG